MTDGQRARQAPLQAIGDAIVRALLPVLGIALFAWDVWSIVLLYWIETGFIGIDAVFRMGVAEGIPAPGSGEPRVEASRREGHQWSFGCGCVFLFLYTGLMIFSLVPAMLGRSDSEVEAPVLFLAAVLASGVAQWREHRRFIETGAYREVTPYGETRAPIKRLFVLWAMVLGTALLRPIFLGFTPLAMIVAKSAAEVASTLEIGWFSNEWKHA